MSSYNKGVKIEEYTEQTQKEVGDALGVSPQSISKIEKKAITKFKRNLKRFPYVKEFIDELMNNKKRQ